MKDYCRRCDFERHICPGCGDNIDHGETVCARCKVEVVATRVGNDVRVERADKRILVADMFLVNLPGPFAEYDGEVLTLKAMNGTWKYRRCGEADSSGAFTFVCEEFRRGDDE